MVLLEHEVVCAHKSLTICNMHSARMQWVRQCVCVHEYDQKEYACTVPPSPFVAWLGHEWAFKETRVWLVR